MPAQTLHPGALQASTCYLLRGPPLPWAVRQMHLVTQRLTLVMTPVSRAMQRLPHEHARHWDGTGSAAMPFKRRLQSRFARVAASPSVSTMSATPCLARTQPRRPAPLPSSRQRLPAKHDKP